MLAWRNRMDASCRQGMETQPVSPHPSRQPRSPAAQSRHDRLLFTSSICHSLSGCDTLPDDTYGPIACDGRTYTTPPGLSLSTSNKGHKPQLAAIHYPDLASVPILNHDPIQS
jgi:hypothetical protein